MAFTPPEVVERGRLMEETRRMESEAPALWWALARHDGPVTDDPLSRAVGGKVLVDATTGARTYALRNGTTLPGPLVVGLAVLAGVALLSAVNR